MNIAYVETGHADSNLNWIVCGGSGLSLRRQRREGAELDEVFPLSEQPYRQRRLVAKSQMFVGLRGHLGERHRPYSFCALMSRQAANLSLWYALTFQSDITAPGKTMS
ncbi:MAG: hypothetical protein HC886_21200 [Leptolyngbyaceae cyanobacterium SM1_1_3]|nr:hypothetical protein [Leptolyngbyaceae cyanobacterium SM1_1_3]